MIVLIGLLLTQLSFANETCHSLGDLSPLSSELKLLSGKFTNETSILDLVDHDHQTFPVQISSLVTDIRYTHRSQLWLNAGVCFGDQVYYRSQPEQTKNRIEIDYSENGVERTASYRVSVVYARERSGQQCEILFDAPTSSGSKKISDFFTTKDGIESPSFAIKIEQSNELYKQLNCHQMKSCSLHN